MGGGGGEIHYQWGCRIIHSFLKYNKRWLLILFNITKIYYDIDFERCYLKKYNFS